MDNFFLYVQRDKKQIRNYKYFLMDYLISLSENAIIRKGFLQRPERNPQMSKYQDCFLSTLLPTHFCMKTK